MIEFAQNFADCVWALKYVLAFLLVVVGVGYLLGVLDPIDEDQIR